MNSKTSHRILKISLFLAMFGMVAFLTKGLLAFVFFSSLILMVTQDRAVPLGVICAILFGACFPKAAALAAIAMAFYVLTHPSPSASVQH
ncbi:MAG: hypothetical protein J0I12_15320 [Candidatus Eremiobacteraeota bacterium]|nr:hypothetical protein [Candidatus Eremiobacteraeota bacterium]